MTSRRFYTLVLIVLVLLGIVVTTQVVYHVGWQWYLETSDFLWGLSPYG